MNSKSLSSVILLLTLVLSVGYNSSVIAGTSASSTVTTSLSGGNSTAQAVITGQNAVITINGDGSQDNPEVVPTSEHELAAKEQLEEPTETKGIASVEKLGTVDLGNEFPQMTGRQLRAREITIEPGGVIAVHQHDARPGFAYILEGEIVEHRNNQAEPILRTQGQIVVEKTGVFHWWENKSDKPVRALVVDIFKPEAE